MNTLKALGRDMPNFELENKILCSLPRSWESKIIVILEVKDFTQLKLEQLIESLTTHEIINSTKEKKKKKKKDLALKVSTHNNDDDDDED